MRRLVLRLAALTVLVGALPPPTLAQAAGKKAPAATQAAPGQPPHAWLFGTWTGGLFPPPSHLTAEACLSQPVVIFTRDVVLRATLIDQLYVQRLIVTALTTPGGTQFQFTSTAPAIAPGAVLGPVRAGVGFGCENPDVLEVQRRTDNQISFPNCSDFPYPLVRCPSR